MLLSRVALRRGPPPAARAPPARRLATGLASLLRVTDEVAAALAQGRPVVAPDVASRRSHLVFEARRAMAPDMKEYEHEPRRPVNPP